MWGEEKGFLDMDTELGQFDVVMGSSIPSGRYRSPPPYTVLGRVGGACLIENHRSKNNGQ